jgi:hypothetical protein
MGRRQSAAGHALTWQTNPVAVSKNDFLPVERKHIRTGLMAGGYPQIDETPIRYLSPGHGQTKLGYF